MAAGIECLDEAAHGSGIRYTDRLRLFEVVEPKQRRTYCYIDMGLC